jgi:hypothetical protein
MLTAVDQPRELSADHKGLTFRKETMPVREDDIEFVGKRLANVETLRVKGRFGALGFLETCYSPSCWTTRQT